MKMAVDAYHIRPQTFPWQPVHFATAIIAAFILRQVAPLGLAGGIAAGITGTILLCLSLFLVLSAIITLRNGGMTVLPPKAARHLITRGPFRYTRNPICLGYIMTLAAFGLLAADAWFFITAITAAMVMTFASIHREEIHLLARFGSQFERYCRRTPRWL